MNITQVEPETLEALNEQVAELDRPMTEVPWWEFDPDDSHQQARVSFIEQFSDGKGAEPVVTDDGVNQSGFANFWEIGPELPPQPKTPNVRTDEPEDHGKELSKNPPQLEGFSNLTETLKGLKPSTSKPDRWAMRPLQRRALLSCEPSNSFVSLDSTLARRCARIVRFSWPAAAGWPRQNRLP